MSSVNGVHFTEETLNRFTHNHPKLYSKPNKLVPNKISSDQVSSMYSSLVKSLNIEKDLLIAQKTIKNYSPGDGKKYFQEGNYSKAYDFYKNRQRTIKYIHENLSQALDDFEKLKELELQTLKNLNNLSLVCLKLNKNAEALKYADKAIKICKNNQTSLYRRAKALLELGQLDDAYSTYLLLDRRIPMCEQLGYDIIKSRNKLRMNYSSMFNSDYKTKNNFLVKKNTQIKKIPILMITLLLVVAIIISSSVMFRKQY